MTHPTASTSSIAQRSWRAPLGMAVGLLGLLGGAACNAGGEDDASSRPITSAAATPRSDGTLATPGSIRTPNPDTTDPARPVDPGTSNTVPTNAPPIGAAVDDVSLGSGSGAAGVAAVTGAADAGVGIADAGAPVEDGGLSAADAGVLDDDQIDDLAEPLPPAVDAGAPLAEVLEDGQIVSVVDALNAGEVEQAQAALPRLQSDAVRAFAQIMIEEHRTARDSFGQLAVELQLAAQDSDVADDLRQRSAQTTAALGATAASQIDGAYLAAQVQAHTEAEALLATLISAADSDVLEAQLSRLRIDVQRHLQSARALQSSLQTAAP